MLVLADTTFSKSLKLALNLIKEPILSAVYKHDEAALGKILARTPPLPPPRGTDVRQLRRVSRIEQKNIPQAGYGAKACEDGGYKRCATSARWRIRPESAPPASADSSLERS
jgi:hypothetical protein